MTTVRTLLLILLMLTSSSVMGQSLFGNQTPKKIFNSQRGNKQQVKSNSTSESQRTKGQRTNVAAVGTATAEKKDTALYVSLTKRFGWYCGISQKLTNEQARHLPCYYRLTEPDSLGHFTHIEAVNGRGLLTTDHDLSTYLVSNDDESDKDADKVWKDLLQTVVQWELTPAGNGHHVAMESGLDDQGNLIYTYIMSLLNDSIVVGHYTDGFGEPVFLRSGDDAAKYVQVKIDGQGYEREIAYLDNSGNFKRNTDEAYMQKKEYDSNGNIICLLSCMINGWPIKDKWGNCGWTADYNEWGQMLHKRYVDENMQAMRMPRLIQSSVDVMTRNYEYDSLRVVREYYLTNEGGKDKTGEGVHCREWQYDEWGNVLCESSKDTNGKLCNDRRGIAQTMYTYDDNGGRKSYCYVNEDGHYVNVPNDSTGICMQIEADTYRTQNGLDTIPVYKFIDLGLETRAIDYTKQQIHIVRREPRKNRIDSSFYNLDMQPVEVDSCFRMVTTVHEEKAKQVMEELRYSFKDTIRTVTITDKKEHTRLVQRFHDEALLSSYGQTLDDNMEITGQFGYDALGNRARSHLEDALYFRVKSGTTYRGEKSYIMGRNEYDEPSYVATSESRSSDIYCTKLFDSNGKRTLLDENNLPIETDSLRSFYMTLNRVYCIEVLTQRAWQLGLRSGDIIVKYGDFYYPQVSKEEWTYRDRLQMDTYLNRNHKKDVLLLRYDEALHRHKMVSLTLPPGSEDELGFLIQTVFYTQKESERYNRYVQQWLHDKKIKQEDFEIDEKHYGTHVVCQIRPFKISTAKMSSWRAGLREDGLVVAIVSINQDGSRTYAGIGDGEKKIWDLLIGKCDSMTVYYTTNGLKLCQVKLPYSGSARSASFGHLPTDEFNRLLELEEKGIPLAYRDSLVKSKSLFSPEQAVRYIRRHSSSEGSFLLNETESDFSKALRILSNQTGVNVKECGISSTAGAWVQSETNDEDKKLISTIFNRIDYSTYEQAQGNGYTIYYQRSTTDSSELSEYVIAGKTYLLVFKGNITLSIDAIKEGSYDKIH